jgi:magnesium-transporting ATPase (P-type)
LYIKGADTVIYERLSHDQPYKEATTNHLEVKRRRRREKEKQLT